MLNRKKMLIYKSSIYFHKRFLHSRLVNSPLKSMKTVIYHQKLRVMKSLYTQRLSFVLFFLCLSATTLLKAQNTNCITGGPQCQSITQDFNGAGSGGFTSTTFAHNPAIDGDMRVITTSSTAYTLTS